LSSRYHPTPRRRNNILSKDLSLCLLEPWKDADQKQLLQFLKTPSGTKFLLTLHDVAAGRALSVAERTPHDYGVTAGMSVMLGLIENMASETDEEPSE